MQTTHSVQDAVSPSPLTAASRIKIVPSFVLAITKT